MCVLCIKYINKTINYMNISCTSRWFYSFINTGAHTESGTFWSLHTKTCARNLRLEPLSVSILGEDGSGAVRSPCKVTGKLLAFRLLVIQRINCPAVFIRGGIKDPRVSLVFFLLRSRRRVAGSCSEVVNCAGYRAMSSLRLPDPRGSGTC